MLSASRLNDFLGCPHQAALWLAGVKPEANPDATLQLIRDKGLEHEAAVLARLERLHGPAECIPPDASLADRARLTRHAIEPGAALIYQGALIKEAWLGFPDFLVRTGSSRVVGFEPEDAKLSRKVKGEYVLQLGIYAELLEALFGIPVRSGTIHVAAGDPEIVDLRRTRHILRRLMRSFERFVADDARVTKPVPCAVCPQCDYKARCRREWREADSPFFVAGLGGAQVVKLAAAGIHTLSALAALSSDTKVDGMGAETVAKLSAQARLQLEARQRGVHFFELLPCSQGRGFALLPAPDFGDLFFDMEGDPFAGEGLEYLFVFLDAWPAPKPLNTGPSGHITRRRKRQRLRPQCDSLSITSSGIPAPIFITMRPTSPRRSSVLPCGMQRWRLSSTSSCAIVASLTFIA